MAVGKKDDLTIEKTACQHCHMSCDVLAYIKEGRVIKVEGDPDSPHNKGMMCGKGLAITQLTYHPDRIHYPLKRAGDRGEGKWARISWDEALGEIASNLNRIKETYGPEAVVFGHGTCRGWFPIYVGFINTFGSPNWYEPGMAQCFFPRCTSSVLTFGGEVMEHADHDHTNCVLVWASNPPNCWPVKAMRIMEAKARGAKLIVADPIFTPIASKADLFLQLRPGTDAALALGMVSVIIAEELYDKRFVEKWTIGFDKLRKRADEYPLSRVEAITQVPAEKIQKAARLYANNGPSCITQCVGIDQVIDTIQTSRAICMLPAITGNVDIPGGNVFDMLLPAGFPDQWRDNYERREAIPDEVLEKRLGFEKYPLLCGNDALLTPGAHIPSIIDCMETGKPYPLKALYIHGSNPLVQMADHNRIKGLFLKMDFISVADLFLTETAEIADIVLPAATWLEWDNVKDSFQQSYDSIGFQRKLVRIGECKSDITIFCELSEKLGLDYWKSEKELMDHRVRTLGNGFDEVAKRGRITFPMVYRKHERKGFNTPSGKIELFSKRLGELGEDPLPSYTESPESPFSQPELAKEYPLILTTGGRKPVYRHSEGRRIPWLRQMALRQEVAIHPETASLFEIEDGDEIVLESPRGQMKAIAFISHETRKEWIQVEPGWEGEWNVNRLTTQQYCAPLVGTYPMRGLLCSIRKATQGGVRG